MFRNAVIKLGRVSLQIGHVKHLTNRISLRAPQKFVLMSQRYFTQKIELGDNIKIDETIELFKAGQYSEAEAKASTALKSCRVIYGDRSDKTANVMRVLIDSMLIQKKYSGVESLCVEYSALCDTIYGPADKYSVIALSNLATCFHNQKKFNLAGKIYIRMLQRHRTEDAKPISVDSSLVGDERIRFWEEILDAMREFGKLYFASGAKECSIALFEEIAKSASIHLPPQHRLPLSSVCDLVIVLQSCGDFDAAIDLGENLVEMLVSARGKTHDDAILWMRNLSALYMQSKKPDRIQRATTILNTVLDAQKSSLQPNHEEIKQTTMMLQAVINAPPE